MSRTHIFAGLIATLALFSVLFVATAVFGHTKRTVVRDALNPNRAASQVVALSLAALLLLLTTAAALAVTGDLTQPAGAAGCVSETGAGPCADGHGLDSPTSVAVSADGKSVYVASPKQRRRNAPQPEHDHRRDHPARRGRRLRERDGGGAVRKRPWAQRRRSGWRSAPTGRAYTSRRAAATPWPASTATRPPGRSPSPPGPPAASARRGRGRAPTAMGSAARPRWRSARTGRASTSPRHRRRRGAP